MLKLVENGRGLTRGVPRWIWRAPIWLYRSGLGWLLGHRFLLLVHTGRKTGMSHQTVLEVVRYEAVSRRCVVVSGFGERASWYRNLRVRPRARICLAGRWLDVVARPLSAQDTAAELRAYAHDHPLAARVMARLLGLRLDSLESAPLDALPAIPAVELLPSPETNEEA